SSFFDTLTIQTGARTAEIHRAARSREMNLREIDEQHIGVSLDETTCTDDIEQLWAVFAPAGLQTPGFGDAEALAVDAIPAGLMRTSAFLTHPVFNTYHSETDMLRYLRSLADKDLALDRTMIPLVSCTMKLNATTEMIPITWKAFSGMHPYAPADQTQGYTRIISDLEQMLCACTGYDAVSLQP